MRFQAGAAQDKMYVGALVSEEACGLDERADVFLRIIAGGDADDERILRDVPTRAKLGADSRSEALGVDAVFDHPHHASPIAQATMGAQRRV